MVDPKALGNEPASPVAGVTETVQVSPAQQVGLTKREYVFIVLLAAVAPGCSPEIAVRHAATLTDLALAELAKDGQP